MNLNALRANPAVALLVLRVGLGMSLFLRHGVEKLTGFSEMAARFPDPFHMGRVPSLVIALLSDGIASLLIAAGAGTRLAAAYVAGNVAVAWLFVHHLEFFGPQAEHGELCALYVCGALTLALSGAGPYSIDAMMRRRSDATVGSAANAARL
ncbi:DoxX family protein [Pendulispora brunnea]|uniref:DoxX family protein n=1 Tax=Pendulispora brunnea TaxID=2905690 RepID=A0ABZ2KCZ1_9BACT